MSKETQLNKEFSSGDLNRIRNIIAGKHGNNTKTQVGFSKKEEDHIEGDVWEENEKQWTIKNGLKQTVTKMDSIKDYIKFPLKCPCCNNAMKKTELNTKMYLIHKTCFNCVTVMETRLKMEGSFEAYENAIMNDNRTSIIDDFEMALDEYSNSISESFITEDGTQERWVGGSGVDVEYIKKMKQEIKDQKSIKI